MTLAHVSIVSSSQMRGMEMDFLKAVWLLIVTDCFPETN